MIARNVFFYAIGLLGMAAHSANAQYSGGTTGSMPGAAGGGAVFNNNYHIGFDRPEAWGLKYFASASLLSGLPAPPSPEGTRFGAVSVSLELDWLPQLDAGQQRIGFRWHRARESEQRADFRAPDCPRGLSHKFTAFVAAPPPFWLFGVHPHLLAFGVERPLVERDHWVLGWRGSGQVG